MARAYLNVVVLVFWLTNQGRDDITVEGAARSGLVIQRNVNWSEAAKLFEIFSHIIHN